MNRYTQTTFLQSAGKLSDLPPDEGIEVAFVGRSNVGKSSLLNTLTRHRDLARVSNTPGRTQLINLFNIDNDRRLVDLPGFGYAKVARSIKENWQKELTAYLGERECLQLLVMVMDIRHTFQPVEEEVLTWAFDMGLPVHVVLNKADKLGYGTAKSILLKTQDILEKRYQQGTVQLFSALKKTGIEELCLRLDAAFEFSQ